jgi:hypothetical protein
VTKVIREEIKNFLESNENKNTKIQPNQNLWDTEKAMLRGNFIGVRVYSTETSHTNNLIMHLKLLEKQEQTKLQTSRWREIIKIRAEINEIET